ncbi:MAG: CDP-glycerol glycerophosphotransferase family protein [Candidatus Thorarchaeota archaeon]
MNLNFLHRILNKYDYLKQNRFYEFVRTIIFPFGLKLISRLFKSKVDDKLIIMGAHGGYAYLDNTKYLFEFLNKHSDYKIVWITRSHELLNKIQNKGYQAAYIYDLKTIRLLRRAKFIFITHGYVDILPIEFSSDTCIILTWHGTPIKILDWNIEKSHANSKWADIFHLNLKFDQYVDYILTPTRDQREHKILSDLFELSPKKVLALGYPKLDYLFNKDEDFKSNLRTSYNIPDGINKIILYCPTYRKNPTLNFPFNDEQLGKLNDLLEDINSIFLIKAHMYGKNINLKSYNNINVVSKTVEIEELYLITDILITDYSSTMLDFSLLNKPILLYPYDLETYIDEVGLCYKLENIAPGPIFFNAEDLLNGIKNIALIDKEFEEKRNSIKNIFNKYTDGKSTQRILNFFNINYY